MLQYVWCDLVAVYAIRSMIAIKREWARKTGKTKRIKIVMVTLSAQNRGDSQMAMVAMPGTEDASGSPWLHVAQHGLKPLHVWGVCVGQLICQTAVETERLQLQPDETEAVLVKQHKEPWGALWTRKAMSSDQTCPVEAEKEKNAYCTNDCVSSGTRILSHSRQWFALTPTLTSTFKPKLAHSQVKEAQI